MRTIQAAPALLLSLALSGCFLFGGGPKSETSSTASPESGASDGKPKNQVTLFGDKSKVSLPPAFSPLTLGMSKDEATKVDPRFTKSGSIGEKRFGKISFFTSWKEDKLHDVWLSLDTAVEQKQALDEATKLWGEPTQGTYLDKPIYAWFNEEDGVLAFISDNKMQFAAYLRLADLLGDTEPFKTPLIGKTKADLTSLNAKWGDDHFDLPPTRYGSTSGFTRVHFEIDKSGKITEYYFGVSHEWFPDKKDELRAALEEKLGKGEERKDGNIVLKKAKPKVHIKYDDIMDGWNVSCERPFL